MRGAGRDRSLWRHGRWSRGGDRLLGRGDRAAWRGDSRVRSDTAVGMFERAVERTIMR